MPVLEFPIPSTANRNLARAGFALLARREVLPRMNTDLATLFAGLPVLQIRGQVRTSVSSLSLDSRRVGPGALFFALPGQKTDGLQFLDDALHHGAVAVVSEKEVWTPPRVALVQVREIRQCLAVVADRFYGSPQKSLRLHGITGTNGKTTCTTLLKHLLETPARPAGLLGTVAYTIGQRTLPSYRTTPEAPDIHSLFAQMRDQGCRHCVMEVSSHGIDQQRVHGLAFATAAFTNLTQDHLDYHGTLEDYFQAKCRLFTGATGQPPAVAAINLDDPYGLRLCSLLPASTRLIRYGTSAQADLRADHIRFGQEGSHFDLHWQGESVAIRSPLPGHYNLSNVLCAFAMALAEGLPLSELAAKLHTFPGVPGRMEKVLAGLPFAIFVDYAHTDDALRNALSMLRPLTPGRLLTVFGCGGNRDRAKRPRMTRAVLELSDLALATADNPRGEALATIFDDMRKAVGPGDEHRIVFIPDRRTAIATAIQEARPGDTILIAGKGHETYQEFADSIIPFDDRAVARDVLRVKFHPLQP